MAMRIVRWATGGGLALIALTGLAAVSAGEGPAAEPPPAPVLPVAPVLPAVNGIDGRVAQVWALRAIDPKIDNTGAQYQVAQIVTLTGTDKIRLKRAATDTAVPEGLPALKERVIEQDGTFTATVTPVIQTRATIQNGQRLRYSMGVYFLDLAAAEEKTRIVTVLPAKPMATVVPPPEVDPAEVRIFRRAGDGVLLTQGESILVDSKSGITVDAAPGYLVRTRGVSVLEVPALGEGVALPGERVVEPLEQAPWALGTLGQLLTIKLPVDAKTGAVNITAGTSWRVAVDLASLCGLPLKHAHAVAVKFEIQERKELESLGEVRIQGSCIFALQGDAFRGENELIGALARLEKSADPRDWTVQGAVGRGTFELVYSIPQKRLVRGTWTETLTQLNLQVGGYERRAYTGTREVTVK